MDAGLTLEEIRLQGDGQRSQEGLFIPEMDLR